MMIAWIQASQLLPLAEIGEQGHLATSLEVEILRMSGLPVCSSEARGWQDQLGRRQG